MDQTGFGCSQNAGLMTLIKAGCGNFDTERCQAGGLLRLFRVDSHLQAVCGQSAGLQVLRRIIGRAGRERRQEELWRGHIFIGAAVLDRLVANHAMASGGDFELRTPEIVSNYFHDHSFLLVKMQTREKGDMTLSPFHLNCILEKEMKRAIGTAGLSRTILAGRLVTVAATRSENLVKCHTMCGIWRSLKQGKTMNQIFRTLPIGPGNAGLSAWDLRTISTVAFLEVEVRS